MTSDIASTECKDCFNELLGRCPKHLPEKLRSSNTIRHKCMLCDYQDDFAEQMKTHVIVSHLKGFSEIMDLYFNERLIQFGHDDSKLTGFNSQFFDRLELFFRGANN